ncbi:DUF6457 domain-containing protein [Streptomyces sp. NPDC003077]|uniref:DUF6457 domain-containing protein n=1 Tax=Streptomyces sp. NPDC003077 TaxID=3154443 RepID=UPI0033AEEEFA
MSDHDPYDALVLAGGAAKRLGGADKPALPVGGRPLLDRVLAACPDAATTVVVGPPRPTVREVVHAREDPPGGGPLAALGAGLRHTSAPVVLVLSADLPFLTRGTVRSLLAAVVPGPDARFGIGEGPGSGCDDHRAPVPVPVKNRRPFQDHDRHHDRSPGTPPLPSRSTTPDGALLRDAHGRDQPLVAAYRSASLHRELAALRAEHGTLHGLPLRALTARLALRRVPDPTATAAFDCDTWEDLSTARRRIREHGSVLDEWITAAKAELGIELDVDTAALLDLARDAAHGVARPAAPLTTFLVGYAAAQQGREVSELAGVLAALANRWAAEGQEAGTASDGPPGAPGKPTDGQPHDVQPEANQGHE